MQCLNRHLRHLQPSDTLHGSNLSFPWCQFDVVFQVQLRLVVTLSRCEINEQVILDSENSVVGDIWVIAGVDLGRHRLISLGGDHKMDVSGAHRVAVEGLEQLSSST